MGLTVRGLARLSATDSGLVSRWERGTAELGSEASLRYLEMIGCRIDPPSRICRACGDAIGEAVAPGYKHCVRCQALPPCLSCRQRITHHPECPRRTRRRCRGCSSTEGMDVVGSKFCRTCHDLPRCPECRRGPAHDPRCSVVRVHDSRPCVACGAAIVARGPRPDKRRYCDACLAKPKCRECSGRGGLHWPSCRWEQRRRYVPPPRRDAVTSEEFVHLYTAYRLDLLRRAAAVVGFHDAEDVAQDTAESLTRSLPSLASLNVNYLRRAVRNTALLTIRRRQRQKRAPEVSLGSSQSLDGLTAGDVFRSDFMQDSGTPLQWAVAWEVVGERERAERMRAERAALAPCRCESGSARSSRH